MNFINKHRHFSISLIIAVFLMPFVLTVSSCGDTSISKQSYDMVDVTFEDAECDYDKASHSLFIKGSLPEGVTVSYSNNSHIDAGQYEVVASFDGDEEHYYPIEDMTATLTINKAKVELPSIAHSELVYDGTEKIVEITGYDSTLMTQTGVTSATNADNYEVNYTLKDSKNYEWASNFDGILKWSIIKTCILSVSFEGEEVTYDGDAHSLVINGTLPSGVLVTYTNNEKIDVGAYVVTAHFTDTTGNYIAPSDMTATLTINKAKLELPTLSNDTFYYDGTKKTVEITGYDSALMTRTGTISATDVGEYTVEYALRNPNNYEWVSEFDGTLTWNIALSLTYTIDENGNATITGIKDNSVTQLTVPSSIVIGSETYPVTKIERSAFSECSALESITLPFIGESPTSNKSYLGHIFGASSYDYSSNYLPDPLREVIISQGCENIGWMAFYNCKYLTSVSIPDSVTNIGDYAFNFCKGLTSITIPNSVTNIGKYAFYECDSLSSVTIPDSVKSIGEQAFYESGLTTIIISDSVISVGSYAFRYSGASIYYEGSSIPSTWESYWNFSDRPVYFYSQTAIYDGIHWHYVDGLPTIWVEKN